MAATVVVGLLLATLEVAGGLAIRRHHDAAQYVTALRLGGAMQTFRPSERAGLAKPVEGADLAPDRSVRTVPSRCAALSLLSVRTPVDGQSWTGVNGEPAQPVNLLTVRLADADQARDELQAKRVALLRCRTVALTFPPFDQPAQTFTVRVRHRLASAFGDQVSYELVGPGKTYGFYVRRYANTLTWTYGDDVSTPVVRRQVADSLVARLHELAR